MLRYLLKCFFIGAMIFTTACEDHGSDEHLSRLVQEYYNLDILPDIYLKEVMGDSYIAFATQVEPGYFAFDFVNTSAGQYVRGSLIQESDTDFSIGSEWGLRLAETVDGMLTGGSRDFSIIFGRVPYGDFSSIEISWNCQKSEIHSLTDNGFFFFSKPMHQMRRCNDIYLHRVNGDRVLLETDEKTGRYIIPSSSLND